MVDQVKSLDGFTLSDLLSDDGMVFEIGDDFDDEEDEAISYSDQVQVTNEEMLRLLNMDDIDEGGNEGEEGDPDASGIMSCALSFDEHKLNMVDIQGDGKILKRIKVAGVGEVVPHNAMVSVHYIGYFEHKNEPFDSTYMRQSVDRIRLNAGNLIVGLDIGIQTMKKNEIAHFIIHPDLAYGQFGCPPRILPNAEVMFAVKLVDYLDNAAADTYENLTYEEKKYFSKIVRAIKDRHATANDYYARYKIKAAINQYNKVVNMLENARMDNEEEEREQKILLTRACVNLAICYNKQNMPRKACVACNKVPNPNAKTYFNHGKALHMMGEYVDSMEKLHQAKKLEPSDIGITKEIQLVNDKYTMYKAREKRLWQNCFSTKNEVSTEFTKAASEICETFAKDEKLLRQPLPDTLAPHEEKCFRDQAARLGLSFTSHVRYGKENFYLSKPKY